MSLKSWFALRHNLSVCRYWKPLIQPFVNAFCVARTDKTPRCVDVLSSWLRLQAAHEQTDQILQSVMHGVLGKSEWNACQVSFRTWSHASHKVITVVASQARSRSFLGSIGTLHKTVVTTETEDLLHSLFFFSFFFKFAYLNFSFFFFKQKRLQIQFPRRQPVGLPRFQTSASQASGFDLPIFDGVFTMFVLSLRCLFWIAVGLGKAFDFMRHFDVSPQGLFWD